MRDTKHGGVLSDDQIAAFCGYYWNDNLQRYIPEKKLGCRDLDGNILTIPMIEPFNTKGSLVSARHGILPQLSSGVSSYGYDTVLADEILIVKDISELIQEGAKDLSIDPKCHNPNLWRKLPVLTDDTAGRYVILPPNSFVLGRSAEYYRIPRNCLVTFLGKSTYARTGINVSVTPLEPEWEGHVTLEFSNQTSLPCRLYVNEGCGQFVFSVANHVCRQSYKDKKGKYQGQTGITPAKCETKPPSESP